MRRTNRHLEMLHVPSSAAERPGTPGPGGRSTRRPLHPRARALLPALLALACGMQPLASGYTVSGAVAGEALGGVTITLTGGPGGATVASGTTKASGAYAIGGLESGRYIATASLAGYTFTPHDGQEIEVAGADLGGVDFLSIATHHDIRGTVRGVVAAGVRLDLAGASTAFTASAADGSYTFAQVVDGTYTVTPSLAGHGFSPGARSVTLSGAHAVGQDFQSSLVETPLHTIAGTVTGAVTAGVTITLQGGAAVLATTVTGASGAFAFADLADGTYLLTPALTGYAFTPRSLAVTLGGADAQEQRFTATARPLATQVDEIATGGHIASGIAIGNDLNAWITDAAGGVVSRVLLQDSDDGSRGDVRDLQLDPADGQPTAIALRFFGLRCFTETHANRIGCVNWGGTEAFSAAIPTPASGAVDIVNGPGATQLSPDMWFAEHDAGKVGRFTITEGAGPTSGAVVAEYVLPATCKPTSLSWNGGNVWWAAEGCGRIGWIVPATGAVHTVDVEVGRPVSLAPNLGADAVWFVDAASDRLGRLAATGGLNWYSPPVGSLLNSVALGPDAALYVTALAGNAVVRFPLASFDPTADPNAGRLTEEFPLPTAGSQPARITSGTDGNVWFTERGQAKIGVVYMPTHCLYGRVTQADLVTPIPLVVVTLTSTGGTVRTTTTDASGDYAFCVLVAGSYSLAPSLGSRTFVPASQQVTMARSNLIVPVFVTP